MAVSQKAHSTERAIYIVKAVEIFYRTILLTCSNAIDEHSSISIQINILRTKQKVKVEMIESYSDAKSTDL